MCLSMSEEAMSKCVWSDTDCVKANLWEACINDFFYSSNEMRNISVTLKLKMKLEATTNAASAEEKLA